MSKKFPKLLSVKITLDFDLFYCTEMYENSYGSKNYKTFEITVEKTKHPMLPIAPKLKLTEKQYKNHGVLKSW